VKDDEPWRITYILAIVSLWITALFALALTLQGIESWP
jgi:hypothetical protein